MEDKLTNSQQAVLTHYRAIAEGGKFYGSLAWIAKEVGISVMTVRRANERLRELGLLRWVSGFGNYKNKKIRGTANQYRLMESIGGDEDRQMNNYVAMKDVTIYHLLYTIYCRYYTTCLMTHSCSFLPSHDSRTIRYIVVHFDN